MARRLGPPPPFMIFDDSTAAIDAGTEQRIRASLREVTRQCATIIIAHRLSSLMHADEILFLDQGQVVERGSHAQLLALGARYAALYELQARRTTAAADSEDAGHAPGNGAAADPPAAVPAAADTGVPFVEGAPGAEQVAANGGNGAAHGGNGAATTVGAAGGRS
ncbi:MAG: ABC transporter ATP-binding protein [Spirochaetaceae bacterium]|nr:ABC transporter ATP-binding protein [Spirochaetaceae bacterium]